MIGWVKPATRHAGARRSAASRRARGDLARRLGVRTSLQLPQRRSGAARARRPGDHREVPAGRLYKDGALLVGADSRTVADRRRLSFVGMVTVALAVNEKGELLAADPEVEMLGIPERGNDWRCRWRMLPLDAVHDTFEPCRKPRRRDPDAVAEACAGPCARPLPQQWGKKPHLSRARADGIDRSHDRTAEPRGDRGARHRQGLGGLPQDARRRRSRQRCRSRSTA